MEHPESTIMVGHLKEYQVNRQDTDYYLLRGRDAENGEKQQKYKVVWELLETIKGIKKITEEIGGQTYSWE